MLKDKDNNPRYYIWHTNKSIFWIYDLKLGLKAKLFSLESDKVEVAVERKREKEVEKGIRVKNFSQIEKIIAGSNLHVYFKLKKEDRFFAIRLLTYGDELKD